MPAAGCRIKRFPPAESTAAHATTGIRALDDVDVAVAVAEVDLVDPGLLRVDALRLQASDHGWDVLGLGLEVLENSRGLVLARVRVANRRVVHLAEVEAAHAMTEITHSRRDRVSTAILAAGHILR